MVFKGKKANIGLVASALLFIVIIGLLLNAFSPTINDLRIEQINEINLSGEENTLLLLFLYALMPLLWVIYVFLSAVLIFLSVNVARGSPL